MGVCWPWHCVVTNDTSTYSGPQKPFYWRFCEICTVLAAQQYTHDRQYKNHIERWAFRQKKPDCAQWQRRYERFNFFITCGQNIFMTCSSSTWLANYHKKIHSLKYSSVCCKSVRTSQRVSLKVIDSQANEAIFHAKKFLCRQITTGLGRLAFIEHFCHFG